MIYSLLSYQMSQVYVCMGTKKLDRRDNTRGMQILKFSRDLIYCHAFKNMMKAGYQSRIIFAISPLKLINGMKEMVEVQQLLNLKRQLNTNWS